MHLFTEFSLYLENHLGHEQRRYASEAGEPAVFSAKHSKACAVFATQTTGGQVGDWSRPLTVTRLSVAMACRSYRRLERVTCCTKLS